MNLNLDVREIKSTYFSEHPKNLDGFFDFVNNFNNPLKMQFHGRSFSVFASGQSQKFSKTHGFCTPHFKGQKKITNSIENSAVEMICLHPC